MVTFHWPTLYLETFSRLRTNEKNIYEWVILKTQKNDKTEKEEKTRGEETSEKCEELEGKGQALL